MRQTLLCVLSLTTVLGIFPGLGATTRMRGLSARIGGRAMRL